MMSMPVPVIKVEKDQFEMSPLPPDFAIDFNDSHKHFGATEPNIKVEQDLDFDQADFDSLEGLIQNYELTHQANVGSAALQNQQGHEDVKPDINKNKKDLSSNDATAPTSVPTGICLQVGPKSLLYQKKAVRSGRPLTRSNLDDISSGSPECCTMPAR